MTALKENIERIYKEAQKSQAPKENFATRMLKLYPQYHRDSLEQMYFKLERKSK